ncbi:MAG: alpha/beta hydrolase [Micavibrio sp.]|nr:alpha/beta hydrolase [Micavibrio sp.]
MTDKRKTIIALHGAGMTAAVFGGIAPLLADHAFHAMTLPGHDDSAAPLQSIEAMADWVKTRIDTSEGRVILLGHSMGALVALQAANAPGVEAVVLMGCAATMPVNGDLLKTAHENPPEAIRLILKWSVYGAGAQAETIKPVLEKLMNSVNPAAVGSDLAACNGFAGGNALASHLHKPALILSATHDKMTKAVEGEGLSRLMPMAKYRVLGDAGHMMMVEQAAETAREIKEFLQDMPAA